MKKILILFLILICSFLNGQQNGQSGVSIRVYYSPDICYRFLSDDSWVADTRDENEIIKYGNSIGTGIICKLNPFIALELGIQYSTKGYQTKKNEVISSEPDSTLPDMIKEVYRYNYLGLPVRLSFIKEFNKFSLRSSLGLVNNGLLKHEYETISYNKDGSYFTATEGIESYNKFALTSVISIGIGYQISQLIEIQIEPTLQYDLLKIKDAPMETYLWNLGLNMSLTYKL